MRVPSIRHALADVRALGASAPVRALYEVSKRSNFHGVLFHSRTRRHFRSSPVLLGRRVPETEEARSRCLADAELIRSEGARVFGDRAKTGFHASWHLDPLSGKEWPRRSWWQIDIRSEKRLSDVKHVWEAGRHRDLVILARAAALDPEGEWLDLLIHSLTRWCAENPPEVGVHWYSSLELALRAIAWSQVLALVGSALPTDVRTSMDDQLVASARHIMTELPYTISSMKNNHMLGDALGLIVLARMFPHHPRHKLWARIGERLFAQQLSRHMRPDGSMVEDSLSYHRFVLEMLIVRHMLGGAPPAVETAMGAAATHLQRIGVLDGPVPQYGDWDEGRVLASSGDPLDVAGSTALALALSGRTDAASLTPEYDELAWYGTALDTRIAERPSTGARSALSDGASGVHVATSGGIAHVVRGPWNVWLKAGAGPSHGHADLTSVWVAHGRQWVIADPGTGTYNGPLVIRNGLRTSRAHPVIRPDGCDQLGPHRAFRWQRRANGYLAPPVNLPDCTVLFGWHDAYSAAEDPIQFARTVVISEESVVIIDAADHARAAWHLTVPLHPAVHLDGSELRVGSSFLPVFGLEYAKAVSGQQEPYLGWHSETYGHTEPATWLSAALPATARHVWGIGDSEVRLRGDGVVVGGHHLAVTWRPAPALVVDGARLSGDVHE